MTEPVEIYRRPFPVMFQHCDPAGIVFYPRYFEMINATVEDFFAHAIGVSFADMHGGARSFGVPAAQVAARFRAPSRLGDVLDVRLAIARLGRSALDFVLTAHGPEGPRLEANLTIVSVDRETLRPRPWDRDVRERIEAMLREAA